MKSGLLNLFIISSLILFSNCDEDYLKKVQNWVDKVYQTIYNIGCTQVTPHPNSYEDMLKKKTISCGWSISITYQQAGLIQKGKKVSHTPACGIHNDNEGLKKYYDVPDLKKSLHLTMTNSHHLKKGSCDLIKVMKKYKELPIWLRPKGVIYVQNSNICISAGNKKVYSCNSSGKQYGPGKSQVLREDKPHEYAFSSLILWAVLPRSNGKSNVPENSPFKHIPC
jgi:hypothetical protein